MMVYKYWDSITREDLEFSVGTKLNTWDVKEGLMAEDETKRQSVFDGVSTEYSSGLYQQPPQHRQSGFYGGGI